MSFCQGFGSWQCWQLDFSRVCVLLHWQHQIPAAGRAWPGFERWDRGKEFEQEQRAGAAASPLLALSILCFSAQT